MTNNIAAITLGDTIILRNREIEHDTHKTIGEIVTHGSFSLIDQQGPYTLILSVEDKRLMIAVLRENEQLENISVPLLPFRRIIKDYELICESYHQAIENAIDPSKVEAIDMGRRGLHNEGSELLTELIEGKAFMDFETARKFFTLLYVLHMK